MNLIRLQKLNQKLHPKNQILIHQMMSNSQISFCEEEFSQYRLNNFQELLHVNITNPNSIYIEGQFSFEGYRKINIHCYVDTGASLCIASKNVIPPELWENTPKPIQVKIANKEILELDKVCKNLQVKFESKIFTIHTVYQQETGIDLIIGNNFCRYYCPFVQTLDKIAFTLGKETIWIPKVTKALAVADDKFLESYKKYSKIQPKLGTNIWKEDIHSQDRYFLAIEKYQLIERLLDEVCSENPIDPKKSKNWMKASIKLINPDTVIKVKPMRYSPKDRDEFDVQIKELLDLGVIIPSMSPHQSPAFLVENEAEKRRGKKRMVVNYKAINEATVGDGHNLPNIQELLTLFRGKTIFSSFDCKSGFWQVLLDEQSQLLTAFTCPQGHYQWKVVPFGLKQAPSIFQRHMQNALRGTEKFCTVYVDDIIVFSDTETEHFNHVLTVLGLIKKYGILLSKKKAKLFKEQIDILGLEIDKGFHKPQNHILENIHKFPDNLEDKKQLQRFLGVLTYAEAYIPKLASMRKPLQAKLKKDVIWNWSAEDTNYIKKIKKGLTNFPKLYLPKPEDFMILETDASNFDWGCVLKARTPNNDELICRYGSGSFAGAQLNYHSNDKEILAVKRGISKFLVYLKPVKFLVRTDNKNFTYFLKNKIDGKDNNGRRVRWQNWFYYFDFEVEHLAGTK
uniref:Enzymatic polyprotein n=1 Tax=Physostegia virginiana caulimovirus 2 TaxID=3075964 RepID=A0AA95Z289_9VIRU|nr:reverse transcriptase [Physostegia virginiana caulimovirus 2]